MGWDAAPFAHVWPTLRPGTSGRLVLPAQRSGARLRASRASLYTLPCFITNTSRRTAVMSSSRLPSTATISASFPSASEPIRSTIPSDSAATDVPLSNASLGLPLPSCSGLKRQRGTRVCEKVQMHLAVVARKR
jgi:hypothetical protein